jgi:hypothetical protein
MRDGGEPPICRVLRPDHREQYHATHNLTKRRKGKKSVGSRADVREGRKKENSGKKYRVSDSGEEGE